MIFRLWLIVLALLCAGCGYRLDGPRDSFEERETISVPYAIGDSYGQLTNALVRYISCSGAYECVQHGGQHILKVVVFSDGSNKIGYRYDRKDLSCKRKKNLIPVESRRSVSAEVTLISAATQEVELGPVVVVADADYDYYNSDTVCEVGTLNDGVLQSTVSFSLGQLDSIEGAQDDVAVPVYNHLAQKIVDGLITHKW